MGATKPMPTTAQIERFVKAMSRANPDLARIRMKPDGTLEAERADGSGIAPAAYDAIDLSKR